MHMYNNNRAKGESNGSLKLKKFFHKVIEKDILEKQDVFLLQIN